MSDRATFIAAIIASPGDDLPRLIYADWLDERGEVERAEFIRVQCELARLEAAILEKRRHAVTGGCCDRFADQQACDCLAFPALRRREQELLDVAAVQDWSAFPAYVLEWWWRRGFVEEIRLPWGDWRQHAPALRAATPLRKVRLNELANDDRAHFKPKRPGEDFNRCSLYDGIEFDLPPPQWRNYTAQYHPISREELIRRIEQAVAAFRDPFDEYDLPAR